MNQNRSESAALDAGLTYFRVPVDDETMPLLLELAEESHCPPALLLAAVAKNVLHHANETGLGFTVMVSPSETPDNKLH